MEMEVPSDGLLFILIPFLKSAPWVIIHLARNAEKGGGVLMSIIFRNLNHLFIYLILAFPYTRIPDFSYARIPAFPYAHVKCTIALVFVTCHF